MIEQIWAAIPSWPGYEASNYGRIRTWSRAYPKLRKPHKEKRDGYLRINLGGGRSARRRTAMVHNLVWEAFNGLRTPGMDRHHIDGDKYNNRIENLMEISPADHTRLHKGGK